MEGMNANIKQMDVFSEAQFEELELEVGTDIGEHKMVMVVVFNLSLVSRIVELLQGRVMTQKQVKMHNYIIFMPK